MKFKLLIFITLFSLYSCSNNNEIEKEGTSANSIKLTEDIQIDNELSSKTNFKIIGNNNDSSINAHINIGTNSNELFTNLDNVAEDQKLNESELGISNVSFIENVNKFKEIDMTVEITNKDIINISEKIITNDDLLLDDDSLQTIQKNNEKIKSSFQ